MRREPKTTRTVSPTSKENTVKRRREHDYGPLFNEDAEWTNDQLDLLLEGFLVYNWRLLSARDCFWTRLGRSKQSIKTYLWKVAVAYPKGATKDYSPRCRTDRTGEPFTARDQALAERTLGEEGRQYVRDPFAHLAKILGRSAEEVRYWLNETANKAPTLFSQPLPQESEEDRLVRLVLQVFAKAFEKAIKSL